MNFKQEIFKKIDWFEHNHFYLERKKIASISLRVTLTLCDISRISCPFNVCVAFDSFINRAFLRFPSKYIWVPNHNRFARFDCHLAGLLEHIDNWTNNETCCAKIYWANETNTFIHSINCFRLFQHNRTVSMSFARTRLLLM